MGEIGEAFIGGVLAGFVGVAWVVNGTPLLLAGLAAGAICIATNPAARRHLKKR